MPPGKLFVRTVLPDGATLLLGHAGEDREDGPAHRRAGVDRFGDGAHHDADLLELPDGLDREPDMARQAVELVEDQHREAARARQRDQLAEARAVGRAGRAGKPRIGRGGDHLVALAFREGAARATLAVETVSVLRLLLGGDAEVDRAAGRHFGAGGDDDLRPLLAACDPF